MPGAVAIELPNTSGVSHNIAVQQGTSGPVLGASSFITKGTTSVSVTLKVGNYTFFCQVPGHRQAGMEGTLSVK
jgi:plastocyanin